MILEKQKQSEVVIDGENIQESIGMTLDLDSAGFLMQMLSKNIYSDEIGSTIRETVSNALDSSRRAGGGEPVLVSLKKNETSGGYEFTVEDFGIGLDDNDVRDIISKYGKSDKRGSSIELGMFGLGFKAPLAYSSSFTFICRKGGKERSYMMYEGEDGNAIDLLYESDTDLPNGVKVIVPVKDNNRDEFGNKIREQLAYFENVYFDVNYLKQGYWSTYDTIKNDFTIHRGEEFQWSELSKDGDLHICLDNVYYPIDFAKLGIGRINIPVGLKFSLTDGVFPTINRESVRYTQEAKEIILNKIKTVADYFVKKYNESVTDTDDLKVIFDYYRNNDKIVPLGNTNFVINSIIKHSSLSVSRPKLNGVEILDLHNLYEKRNKILNEYTVTHEITGGRITSKTSKKLTDYAPNVYIHSAPISEKVKTYLRDIHHNDWIIVKKKISHTLWGKSYYFSNDDTSYYTLLELNKHPRNQWRQIIQEFQFIQKKIMAHYINLDELEIPKEWFEKKKKERENNRVRIGRTKLEGEINCKIADRLERYVEGKSCKFVPETLKLAELHKFNKLSVYGNREDGTINNLNNLFSIYRKRMRILTFSDRDLKTVNELNIHNLMSYEKFMEGKNKLFKRAITSYLINKLEGEYPYVFSKTDELFSISKTLNSKLTSLREYRKKHFERGEWSKLYEAMLEVATENNLFDESIYSEYIEMKNLLEKLPFLDPMLSNIGEYRSQNKEGMRKALVDLFKYYKMRIDYKNYNLKLEEEEEVVNN